MQSATNKRDRLLEWIRDGDPSRVPILIGPGGFFLTASYFDIPYKDCTWELAERAAIETGTENHVCVGSPFAFHAIPFTDKLDLKTTSTMLDDGTERVERVLTTPSGTLNEIIDRSLARGNARRKHLVENEEDLPAFESFIRIACQTIRDNPAVREDVRSDMLKTKDEIAGFFPIDVHIFAPTQELMSCHYVGQTTAVFMLYDHRELMEELFDIYWKSTEVWLDLAAEVDVDIYSFAVNGLEWLSVDMYEEYAIPDVKRIADFAESQGKLSWLHTCGKKKGLIERDFYSRMGVTVLESFSAPPTGDIEDYAWARRKIGSKMLATRGGINTELFYRDDLDALKAHTHKVLDGFAGSRHMIGDTNTSFPPYPWKNIQTVIDVVKERGAAFE